MAGLIESILRRVEKRQQKFFERLSDEMQEKLREAEGRCAKLTAAGPEGGVFYILYQGGLMRLTDSPFNVRNKIWLTDSTFLDIAYGRLSPREARSHGLILISGDTSAYDSEELAQGFEDWVEEIRGILLR